MSGCFFLKYGVDLYSPIWHDSKKVPALSVLTRVSYIAKAALWILCDVVVLVVAAAADAAVVIVDGDCGFADYDSTTAPRRPNVTIEHQ